MIRIKKIEESYDLKKIKDYMNRLGFNQIETPMTYQYENSGFIAFQRDNWKIEFAYPSESLMFSATKGLNGSWISIKLSDIKSIQCDSVTLHIFEKNGSEMRLWAK